MQMKILFISLSHMTRFSANQVLLKVLNLDFFWSLPFCSQMNQIGRLFLNFSRLYLKLTLGNLPSIWEPDSIFSFCPVWLFFFFLFVMSKKSSISLSFTFINFPSKGILKCKKNYYERPIPTVLKETKETRPSV